MAIHTRLGTSRITTLLIFVAGGAAIGAGIGSGFGGLGTVVGAVGGAIVGFFAWLSDVLTGSSDPSSSGGASRA